MLNALQIDSSEDMVGFMFLRNHDEIVDCGMADSSDNLYSLQPRSSLN